MYDRATRLAFRAAAILLFACPAVDADWIHAQFSPEAGIDSLERFLVLRDHRDSTFFGFCISRLGDVNDDSVEDLLIARSDRGLTYADDSGFVFWGGEPFDTTFERPFYRSRTLDIGSVGDVNADGFADWGLISLPGVDFELHFGSNPPDEAIDFAVPSMFSRIRRAADLDDDGALDLVLSTDVNGGYVNIYRIDEQRDTIPEYVIPDTSARLGENITIGDFNGDSQDDLAICASHRDSNFVKFFWGGPDFDTVPDFEMWSFSPQWGKLMLPTGDFNGDGYDDVFISGGANDPYGVYFCGPQIDNEMDLALNRFRGYTWFPPSSGDVADINNDGHPDIILGYWVGTAYLPEVYVHLGGPVADTVCDIWIDAYSMVPGGQWEFGNRVFGVGDFSGDGIDDFAVYCRNEGGCCWRAEVNFFGGWDANSTDVPVQRGPAKPDAYHLSANYPNPFNPMTTIEFEVPRRSFVRMTIYNVLGQEIRELLHQVLTSGSYTIAWDGCDREGRPVSSGVYLYRLEVGDFTATRKMMLLR